MLRSLDDIVARLVDCYEPDRIILFGSAVSEGERPSRDLDLLIIKHTSALPLERRMEVERLLLDRRIPLDLQVYTPQEVRDLYATGNPFIEEVMESGRVLYMRRETAAWVAEAREELEMAGILLDHGKHRGVCFHCQQGVEKGLKAFLLERGKRPPRTHDIVELLNAVAAEGWTVGLAMEEAIFLNSVYRGRYPTEQGLLPHGDATEADARRAVAATRVVLESLAPLLE